MAQATDLPTTSRFHNLSSAALADALGHADAMLKGAEAECIARQVAALKQIAANVPPDGVAHAQSKLRALPVFGALPADHGTFLVTEGGAEPHLCKGEYAVIDFADRRLQHGEIYVIQSQSGARHRRIDQARSSYCNITGPDAEDTLVWWLSDLTGFRKTDDKVLGVPLYAGLSDGPYLAENLSPRLLGRVVGFAHSPLGGLLAPEAGYENEAAGNAAFDPREYIDTLIAAGYRPSVHRGTYFEEMPHRRRSKAEERAVLAVRWKFCAASTAVERVKQECIRRGLIDG